MRLLHGFEVDGKKLVAKVDAKNQELLDTAKTEENKKSDANNTRNSDAATEKKNDDMTLDRLAQILEEYKEELKAANSGESKATLTEFTLCLKIIFHFQINSIIREANRLCHRLKSKRARGN